VELGDLDRDRVQRFQLLAEGGRISLGHRLVRGETLVPPATFLHPANVLLSPRQLEIIVLAPQNFYPDANARE
jgi:hypothetical protein